MTRTAPACPACRRDRHAPAGAAPYPRLARDTLQSRPAPGPHQMPDTIRKELLHV
jgi:hypothetical protein